MKIIDLLNKITNGEEVPKKIKYENRILYLEDEAEEYEPTFNYYDKDGNHPLFEGWIGQYLNDEVEILEGENKIPEKLGNFDIQGIEVSGYSMTQAEYLLEDGIKENRKAINNILDYLKSKGDE